MMSMRESGKDSLFQDPWLEYDRVMENKDNNQWVIKKCLDRSSSSSSSSSFETSTISSSESSSSIDTIDDASSSVTCLSSSSNSDEGSYDLSELMAELPIKRGLSKFYQGKSESFTCLSRVTSIEDLAKKVTPYKRKMKSSKSYGGLHAFKSYTLPKPVILKKTSLGSLSSISLSSRTGSLINRVRPSQILEKRARDIN